MLLRHHDVRSIDGDRVRFIEVKGTDGFLSRRGVALTRTQMEFSKANGPHSWVYIVENARDPSAQKVHPIRSVWSRVDRFVLDEGWVRLADPQDPA
jgi:hypothetical protein